jgi:hypothetical protein
LVHLAVVALATVEDSRHDRPWAHRVRIVDPMREPILVILGAEIIENRRVLRELGHAGAAWRQCRDRRGRRRSDFPRKEAAFPDAICGELVGDTACVKATGGTGSVGNSLDDQSNRMVESCFPSPAIPRPLYSRLCSGGRAC